MQRIVIYATDLEPITVVELSAGTVDFIKRTGEIRLVVMPPAATGPGGAAPTLGGNGVIIQLYAEIIRFAQGDIVMLFTRQEEAALRLKAAFLPGQYGAVQRREAEAFRHGVISALQRLR